MTDHTAAFDDLMGHLGQRALVVTARHDEAVAGCLVGFATQVSIHPRLFLACLSEKNHTFRVAAHGASHLAVHLLPAGRDDLAELFGGQTGDDVDKLAHCRWHEGPGGVPLLNDCPDRFVGLVTDRHVMGDHVGFVLEPVVAQFAGGETMSVARASRVDPGHEA